MSFSLQRPAIAMIELIFAIVVMGIVMMSAPQLLSTASQSGYVAIQQEGINEAATQINMILDFPWDENDTNISHTTLLFVSNGDPELNGTNTTPFNRAGTPANSYRVYVTDGGISDGLFNASTIGLDVNDNNISDDIDDFNNSTVNLTLDGPNAGESDYIEKGDNVNITRTVDYVNDNASYNSLLGGNLNFDFNTSAVLLPSTNIKRIQVTLTSASGVDELAKNITLHAFSCNIGTYKLKESP